MIFYLLQRCAFTNTKHLAVNCVNTKVFILLDACMVIVSGIYTLCIPPHPRVFILQLNRNGNSQHPGGLAMDRLNYTYRDGTHQLWSVQDGIAAGAYAGDINNQVGSIFHWYIISFFVSFHHETTPVMPRYCFGSAGLQPKTAG